MGAIEVPADHYWGAQTQRSLIHFSIGDDRMPTAVYHAYGYVKKAAALINAAAGRLDLSLAHAIVLELAVCLLHRVGVDGELEHHLLDRRQLVADVEDPHAYGLAHLLDELQIGRHTRVGPQVEGDRLG